MPDLPGPRTAGTPHIIVPWPATVLRPRAPRSRGGSEPVLRPHDDRRAHVDNLVTDLHTAHTQATTARSAQMPEHRADGIALHVEAAAGYSLNLEKLDKAGTTLMSARPSQAGVHGQDAVIWLPDTRASAFTARISAFAENAAGGQPRQNDLVANIEHLHAADPTHLWPYASPLPVTPDPVWWELWFDPALHNSDPLTTLRAIADARGWQIAGRGIAVGYRIVASVRASTADIASLMGTNACPTELRLPSFAEQIHGIDGLYQADWVKEAANRILPAPPGAPAVCVLDSGVYAEHPLLKAALNNRAWSALGDDRPGDQNGHGTAMAGLALFGDRLLPALEHSGPVRLDHHLESVRILLPPGTDATPRTFGEVTVNGISLAEASATPAPRARVFSLAVTRTSDNTAELTDANGVDGTATVWSAALDAVAAGTTIGVLDDRIDLAGAPDPEMARLIIVSAGNVRHLQDMATQGLLRNGADYLDICDLARIEDPSHAWNVLCVGAHTELDGTPHNSLFDGYQPLAPVGELSPYSRTGTSLPGFALIKPDIVLEGGNMLRNEDTTILDGHDVLHLATTSRHPHRPLTSAQATSAATAQAARLAALAHVAYPDLHPEAVRGLLVHEARWTDAMAHGLYTRNGTPKGTATQRARRLRRYGWGVPTEDRVLNSAANAVTIITQNTLTPYRHTDKSTVGLAELNLHELPWPAEQLEDLGETPVELRVTLSYFIEPNPGRQGMLRRHTYASHRLRYALQGPGESDRHFRQRISTTAQDSTAPGGPDPFETDDNWLLGPTARERGSLHCDIWRGNAVTLARCNTLAVYPIASGWWKTHARADRIGQPVRYALLVSLSTPEIATDLYTPIATALDIRVAAQAQVEAEQLAFEVDLWT